jgi:hypothetical protein
MTPAERLAEKEKRLKFELGRIETKKKIADLQATLKKK